MQAFWCKGLLEKLDCLMERFAVGLCTIDDGKEGVLLYCCLVEGVQLCEFDMDNDGDDEDDNDDDNDNDNDYDIDDDADAGCPPPTYFLPLSVTLDRYLEDVFGFPPVRQGNEDDY